MQNHYEINISLSGKHFFATNPRSLVSHHHAVKVYTALRARFPSSEGYNVTMTHWQCSGTDCTPTPDAETAA